MLFAVIVFDKKKKNRRRVACCGKQGVVSFYLDFGHYSGWKIKFEGFFNPKQLENTLETMINLYITS
jgi:hypothetical protein